MTLRMRTMGAVAVAAVAGATLTAQTVQINGAGATFPYPIYSKWFSEYNKINSKVQINYQSIGSGGGIRQVTERTVFFGATDGPMTASTAGGRARKDPALPHRARRRRPGLQHPRCQAGTEVHGSSARRHHDGQDHEVERCRDRQAEPRCRAPGVGHRRGSPIGRLRYDLYLGRLPVEGLAGVPEDSGCRNLGQMAGRRRRQGQ